MFLIVEKKRDVLSPNCAVRCAWKDCDANEDGIFTVAEAVTLPESCLEFQAKCHKACFCKVPQSMFLIVGKKRYIKSIVQSRWRYYQLWISKQSLTILA
jgi:hypothetical protein